MVDFIDPFELGLDVGEIKGHEAFVTCPFHSDTNPSAHFDLIDGLFFCFTCGAAKNARQLADHLDGRIVRSNLSGYGIALAHNQMLNRNYVAPAVEAFSRAKLATGHKYLDKRQVTDAQVERFNIRRLPGQILFPMVGSRGVEGVQVRFKAAKPKYKIFGKRFGVWPFMPVYSWDEMQTNVLVVVEGVFGVLRADLFGWHNVVAVLSATNAATVDMTFAPHRFKVCFDADEAGVIGAMKLNQRYQLACRVILPGYETDELDQAGWQKVIDAEGETSQNEIVKTIQK